jgi:hypothetical protein
MLARPPQRNARPATARTAVSVTAHGKGNNELLKHAQPFGVQAARVRIRDPDGATLLRCCDGWFHSGAHGYRTFAIATTS